jgi:Phage integrase family
VHENITHDTWEPRRFLRTHGANEARRVPENCGILPENIAACVRLVGTTRACPPGRHLCHYATAPPLPSPVSDAFRFPSDIRNLTFAHSPISSIFLTCGKQGWRRNFAILHTLGITPRIIQLLVTKVANCAPISCTVSPHVLRHTFAVAAVQQGISLPALQRLLGHDRLTTTEIYVNLSPEEVVRELRETW